MTLLRQKIVSDIKESQKNKLARVLMVLRMLNASIHNKEIEKRTRLNKIKQDEQKLEELSKLNDEEIIEIISSEIKKRREAIEQYERGHRLDLAAGEMDELEILYKYMPLQLSEGEIRQLVDKIIKDIDANSLSDLGRVMAVLVPKTKGRADGALLSRVVKEKLKQSL